jgi:acetyltransferase-like isoleucine patch superfamily enzyme
MIRVAPTAHISHLADIEDSKRGSKIVIEEGAFIDAFVKLKAAGGNGDVRIGRNCSINSGVVIYIGNGVTIGADVAIGANTTLAPTNHEFRSRDLPIREQRFLASRGGIVIEDDVWIGANCVLLDGTVLRKGCVLGAGSLVNHELPAYSINYGQPAKTVGFRGEGRFALPAARGVKTA